MKTRLGTHLDFTGDFVQLGRVIQEIGIPAYQTYLSTRQNSWWPMKPEEEVTDRFQEFAHLSYGVAHAPFVFNILTDPNGFRYANNQWKGLLKQLNLASRLGIKHVVVHPGSAKGQPEDKAMSYAVYYLAQVFGQYEGTAKLALENSANIKTGPAAKFDSLVEIINTIKDDRLELCLDVTHAFAAGFDLRNTSMQQILFRKIEPYVGVVHFNQPLPEVTLGSYRDRHASNLDAGPIPLPAMKNIWQTFEGRPFILEGTPNFQHDYDIVKGWEDESGDI